MNDELETLRTENVRLTQQLKQQQRDSMSRHSLGGDAVQLDFIHAQQELSRCKEALIGSSLRPYLFLCTVHIRTEKTWERRILSPKNVKQRIFHTLDN